MAPLPQNNTNRLLFDYVTGDVATSQAHTCAVRYNPAERDVGDVQADFLSVLAGFGEGLFRVGWKVTGVRVQAAGSNFSLPVTMIASLAAFEGIASVGYTPKLEAVELTFQGRSTTSGRRVDFSIYNALFDVGDNFRFLEGSAGASWVADVLDAVRAASAVGSFLAIDLSAPTWYGYANANYNSYWERRMRSV